METFEKRIRSIDHAFGGDKEKVEAAAHDPALTNTEQQVAGEMLRDQAKGAHVYTFDPDATPEQKAATAGRAKTQLAPVAGAGRLADAKSKGGRAVTIDTSGATGTPSPTVTLADVDKASRAEGQASGSASSSSESGSGSHLQDALPGSIPASAAPPVPTWMQTGWLQVAGLDKSVAADEKQTQQMGILADYLSENSYGTLYHNAGIILFSVFVTRFITVIHLGWGWVFLIFACCASYYSLSISRTRARARDDIQRELVKTRLVTETESADWLNQFLDRFWLIYEPVLSQTIVASVDSVLSTQTPPGIESIRMTTFTLGTKAPRIDYVRTFPKTPEDVVIMDWAISFTPNDLQDITPRQAAKRVNPKIVLAIRIGKGVVSKALHVLLADMSFSGRMRIKLKLMTNFPHVQTIDMSFIEKPTFDYVLKPFGGETFGFDINNIPGLAPFIRDQVHANLGPMMYDPNVFTIDLQALLSGNPLDSSIGVLKVQIWDARGVKAVKLGGGDPDPYVAMALGGKPAITKTKTITSTSHPSWNESQFLLINSLADVLNLSLWDYNEHRPDNLLGTVSHELGTLDADAEQEGLVGKIIQGGKERGELRYDLSYFPVLKPQKHPDGTLEPMPETQTGIVRLTLHQAKDFDFSAKQGALSCFARVYLGSSRKDVHQTPTIKHQSQPIWESSCEFLVPERHNSVITITVTDVRDYATDPTIGTVTVKLADLLEARERQQDWWPLSKSKGAKIRLSTEWKPVAMAGSIAGGAVYVPPIGVMRLWLKKAVDVKNVEGALGGKSDPYVRVMANNKVLARTEVLNNNLNPEWDQIVYVPVHSVRERLILELMDYQNIGRDRTLGTVELSVKDFAEESGENQYPYRSTGHKILAERIRLDKNNSYKGTLYFEADFKPAVSLRGGVSFAPQNHELDTILEQEQADGVEPRSAGLQTSVDGLVTSPTALSPIAAQSPAASGHRPSLSVNSTGSIRRSSPLSPARKHSVKGSMSGNSFATQESKAGGEATLAERADRGVTMTTEDLLHSQSGVIAFQVISGQLARRGALEVMFDDGYWPSFTSTRPRTNKPTWDEVGEGFIRELDLSRIWLRINASEDMDEIVAEYRSDTLAFLEACIREPQTFKLSPPGAAAGDSNGAAFITMTARFIPVNIQLEPRETVNNMGILRTTAVSATGLAAADRSGKSDPYVIFRLNGREVHRTEVRRKTLSPTWNESFECIIPSRVAAKLEFDVNDWDRVGTSDHLGSGTIDLSNIPLVEQYPLTLPVTTKNGEQKGTITFNLLFQPEIVARSRQKTSTFSTAGRAITQIGGVPVGVGKGAVHGIGMVGGFAGRKIGLIKKKDKTGKEVLVPADSTDGLFPDNGVSDGTFDNGHSQNGTTTSTLSTASAVPPVMTGKSEPGTVAVTVISAKDLKSSHSGGPKAYVRLELGSRIWKTEHVKSAEPQFGERFTFNNVLAGSSTMRVTVQEHHTMGKDNEIGQADVDVLQHLNPPVLSSTELAVELTNGSGQVRLKLDWSPAPASPAGIQRSRSFIKGRTPSISSKKDSPSRFAMFKKEKDNDASSIRS